MRIKTVNGYKENKEDKHGYSFMNSSIRTCTMVILSLLMLSHDVLYSPNEHLNKGFCRI